MGCGDSSLRETSNYSSNANENAQILTASNEEVVNNTIIISTNSHNPPRIQRSPASSIRDFYILGEEVGRGSFGVVRSAVNKTTKERVAVKIMAKSRDSKKIEIEKNRVYHEVNIMKTLRHKNIVQQIDFFEDDRNYYSVLEFIEGGELFDRIAAKQFYNENDARNVVHDVLSAMQYCHSKNIAHRDLKPANLLVLSREDDSHVKIADFGLAKEYDAHNILKTQCGTPAFVAPEIISRESHYDSECDMWAIGVVTYVLLAGFLPFQDDNIRNLFKKIRKGEFTFPPDAFDAVSDSVKDFIRDLLVVDPKARLTAAQALDHAWMKVSSEYLSSIDLMKSINNLSEFRSTSSKTKLKGAAFAVLASFRMAKSKSGKSDEDDGSFDKLDDFDDSSIVIDIPDPEEFPAIVPEVEDDDDNRL